MRKGTQTRQYRPARPSFYDGRPCYAGTVDHRIRATEQAISEAIAETIERTRRDIVAELREEKKRQ